MKYSAFAAKNSRNLSANSQGRGVVRETRVVCSGFVFRVACAGFVARAARVACMVRRVCVVPVIC